MLHGDRSSSLESSTPLARRLTAPTTRLTHACAKGCTRDKGCSHQVNIRWIVHRRQLLRSPLAACSCYMPTQAARANPSPVHPPPLGVKSLVTRSRDGTRHTCMQHSSDTAATNQANKQAQPPPPKTNNQQRHRPMLLLNMRRAPAHARNTPRAAPSMGPRRRQVHSRYNAQPLLRALPATQQCPCCPTCLPAGSCRFDMHPCSMCCHPTGHQTGLVLSAPQVCCQVGRACTDSMTQGCRATSCAPPVQVSWRGHAAPPSLSKSWQSHAGWSMLLCTKWAVVTQGPHHPLPLHQRRTWLRPGTSPHC